MKRIIALTLTLILSIMTIPAYAYSDESIRLGKEAGCYVGDYDLDEVLARQEALKNGQANNSTPTTQNGQNKANKPVTRRIKGGVDEYRVIPQGGNESTKITDTKDGLHIYSNEYADGYANAYYGSKNSYDEFHTAPYDIGANDGYKHGDIDELHINENYRQNVWKPDYDVYRISIDEFRLPNEM